MSSTPPRRSAAEALGALVEVRDGASLCIGATDRVLAALLRERGI